MERVSYASLREWRRPPLVPMIIERSQQASFANATRRDALLEEYGSQVVEVTSSNSYSEHSSSLLLREYLDRSPSSKANESLYLFGPNSWLRADYETPECAFCGEPTASFGVGVSGSGVSFHTHGSGFAEVIHGRKRWIFYRDEPEFDPNASTSCLGGGDADHECVAGPGELLYFPKGWWHATENLDDYNVFVSTFVHDDILSTLSYPLL